VFGKNQTSVFCRASASMPEALLVFIREALKKGNKSASGSGIIEMFIDAVASKRIKLSP
jgi:hypothetical protein